MKKRAPKYRFITIKSYMKKQARLIWPLYLPSLSKAKPPAMRTLIEMRTMLSVFSKDDQGRVDSSELEE